MNNERIGIVKYKNGKEIQYDTHSDFLLRIVFGIFKINNIFFNFSTMYECNLININGRRIIMEKEDLQGLGPQSPLFKKFPPIKINLPGMFIFFNENQPNIILRKIYGGDFYKKWYRIQSTDLNIPRRSTICKNLMNYVNEFLYKKCCQGNEKFKYEITTIASITIIRIFFQFGIGSDRFKIKIGGCKKCIFEKFQEALIKMRIDFGKIKKGIYKIKNL